VRTSKASVVLMSGLLVVWLASTWVPATRAHHHEACSIRAERACIALALVSFAARAVLFRMRGAEVIGTRFICARACRRLWRGAD
jgi:hypothetical protein